MKQFESKALDIKIVLRFPIPRNSIGELMPLPPPRPMAGHDRREVVTGADHPDQRGGQARVEFARNRLQGFQIETVVISLPSVHHLGGAHDLAVGMTGNLRTE